MYSAVGIYFRVFSLCHQTLIRVPEYFSFLSAETISKWKFPFQTLIQKSRSECNEYAPKFVFFSFSKTEMCPLIVGLKTNDGRKIKSTALSIRLFIYLFGKAYNGMP
jgi:hypothetical protein